MTEYESEMDPCPFCGSDRIVLEREPEPYGWNDRHKLRAICEGCGARTGLCYTEAEAAGAWNRRERGGKPFRGLEPCPFCGGRARIEADDNLEFAVVCIGCESRSTSSEDDIDHEDITRAWNRRASGGI